MTLEPRRCSSARTGNLSLQEGSFAHGGRLVLESGFLSFEREPDVRLIQPHRIVMYT